MVEFMLINVVSVAPRTNVQMLLIVWKLRKVTDPAYIGPATSLVFRNGDNSFTSMTAYVFLVEGLKGSMKMLFRTINVF